MKDILEKLKGGDRRSIGRVEEVVQDVLSDPSLFRALFKGLSSGDPVIRMRSADAVEKITATHPDYLQPYKAEIMGGCISAVILYLSRFRKLPPAPSGAGTPIILVPVEYIIT